MLGVLGGPGVPGQMHGLGWATVSFLQLKLLGNFEARDDSGRSIVVKARKNRALLAALALAPSHAMPREYLAGLLWSDRAEDQARSSLRQAIVALRSDFSSSDASFLSVRDMNVAIDPARAEIDAVEFQRLASANDLASLWRAITFYRGDLLADIHIRNPVFDEWVTSERRRLSDVATTVLEKLCALETGQARVDLAKRLVALDPLREDPHRILMQFYHDSGEMALALRQYDICRTLLRNELQIAPSEETEALYHRLRSAINRPKPGFEIPRDAATNSKVVPLVIDKPLVAVLPFDNFGGDPEIEKFCNGLTEDLIVGLSRISTIRVVAGMATSNGKRRAIDGGPIAGHGGVSYALEGSVRKSAKITRVTAKLIDATSGHHLWAQQINRKEPDIIFDLQDDITRSIVASVQTQIILSEGRQQTNGSGADHLAGLLARSWQRFLSLTEESLAESAALSERALKLDSRNGTAHRMRAVALYHQVYMGFIPWTTPTIDALHAHAKISIESDGADEYSHWAMECAHLLRKEHDLAVASLNRALEINPNCSLAIGSMGTVLAWSGQYDASVERNELALHANPQDPSNFFRHFGLALAHYLAGRYYKAVAHARMVAQERPCWRLAKLIYAASLAQSQRPDEAARILADLQPAGREVSQFLLNMLPFAHVSDREHVEVGLVKTGLWASTKGQARASADAS